MPNGSNQFTKQQVQAGQVCYVCETATPTIVDDIGGAICQDCYNHMQNVILQTLLKRGYHARKGRRS